MDFINEFDQAYETLEFGTFLGKSPAVRVSTVVSICISGIDTYLLNQVESKTLFFTRTFLLAQ